MATIIDKILKAVWSKSFFYAAIVYILIVMAVEILDPVPFSNSEKIGLGVVVAICAYFVEFFLRNRKNR